MRGRASVFHGFQSESAHVEANFRVGPEDHTVPVLFSCIRIEKVNPLCSKNPLLFSLVDSPSRPLRFVWLESLQVSDWSAARNQSATGAPVPLALIYLGGTCGYIAGRWKPWKQFERHTLKNIGRFKRKAQIWKRGLVKEAKRHRQTDRQTADSSAMGLNVRETTETTSEQLCMLK